MTNEQITLDEKLKAIKQLLDLFKFERVVYLTITVISLVILIICAIYLIKSDKILAVLGMFTSSGGVAFTCGRLLRMWSDAMQLLGSINKED
jgi:hypothetical protein